MRNDCSAHPSTRLSAPTASAAPRPPTIASGSAPRARKAGGATGDGETTPRASPPRSSPSVRE
eukprot:717040-Pyramimonas_sp.AAC.1